VRSSAAAADAGDPNLGKVFGPYEAYERHGGGKSGPIYKARHRQDGRIVTLKLLPREALRTPEVVKRFHREVELTTRLDHPNLIVAYDAGEQDGVHYLAMEYVSGTDLATVLAQQGRMPVDRAIDCLVQAAEGLAYLHSQGVYHRNIKPHNLLLDGHGRLKIANLLLARLEDGSALAADESEDQTKTGQLMGSVDYLPPEQAADASRVDQRADIYALGCTFYHLIVGQPPYKGKTLMDKLVAHRDQPIPSLQASRANVPDSIERVYQKMMAKDPAQRYASMTKVIRDVQSQGLSPALRIVLPVAVCLIVLLLILFLANR
jgi:serine/threonine protein kinase